MCAFTPGELRFYPRASALLVPRREQGEYYLKRIKTEGLQDLSITPDNKQKC